MSAALDARMDARLHPGLPLFVADQDLQENPKFAALLQELARNHITPLGACRHSEQQLLEV